MYICLTHVDSITRVPCTDAPMANGPDYPALNRLVIEWWNQSEWPTTTPKYYGYCKDDSDTDTPGVLEVLTAAEYGERKRKEMLARQPYPSWQFDEDTLTWSAPVPQPWPGDEWDEAAGEWVMTEQSRESRNSVSLTRAEFKLALLDAGYLKDVKAFIAQTNDERIKIMWEDSATFKRGRPDLIRLVAELGYTDEQVDALFRAATQPESKQ